VERPEAIYRHLREIGLAHLQFIPCAEPEAYRPDPEAYGRFLCAIYDLWRQDFRGGVPQVMVRNFESLLHLYAGLEAPECTLMPSCGVYVVVEHDGGVYACDFYVDDEHRLGDVMSDDLQALLDGQQQHDFGRLKTRLHHACRACPWQRLCQGGCTHHRPSPPGLNWFCESFKALFRHAGKELAIMGNAVARQQQGIAPEPAIPPGKVGRNDPCPCGSGKKFKRCCG